MNNLLRFIQTTIIILLANIQRANINVSIALKLTHRLNQVPKSVYSNKSIRFLHMCLAFLLQCATFAQNFTVY